MVDRAQAAIDSIDISSQVCEKVVADIENGPWPFAGRQFDAQLVKTFCEAHPHWGKYEEEITEEFVSLNFKRAA